MQELWTGVKTKIPRGTNKSLQGPQLLKWLQRIIAESYNRTESMPFSPGNKKKRKKKKKYCCSDYVILKDWLLSSSLPQLKSQLQTTRNMSRKIMVHLKARSIWDYIFTGAVTDNIWEERKKRFSLAVFISMFGLFKRSYPIVSLLPGL